jgi:hypothetical protein
MIVFLDDSHLEHNRPPGLHTTQKILEKKYITNFFVVRSGVFIRLVDGVLMSTLYLLEFVVVSTFSLYSSGSFGSVIP